jgi:hypothetical protein
MHRLSGTSGWGAYAQAQRHLGLEAQLVERRIGSISGWDLKKRLGSKAKRSKLGAAGWNRVKKIVNYHHRVEIKRKKTSCAAWMAKR